MLQTLLSCTRRIKPFKFNKTSRLQMYTHLFLFSSSTEYLKLLFKDKITYYICLSYRFHLIKEGASIAVDDLN